MQTKGSEGAAGREVTLRGREYAVYETGMRYVLYTLRSGELRLQGIRSRHQPNVIIAMDRRSRVWGHFDDRTNRELLATVKGGAR